MADRVVRVAVSDVVPGPGAGAADRLRGGGVVMIAGPDGVGKSTLARAMSEGVLSDVPVLLVHHRRGVGILPGRRMRGSGTEPHRHPPYPWLLSLLKLIYLFVDFRLGWAVRIRPFVRRGGWVVLQRNWWDLMVDPTRYRLKSLPRVTRFLGRRLPQPDLTLILEAPSSVIRARKDELSAEELDRQKRAWRDLVGGERGCVFVDAALPLDEVTRMAKDELASAVESRFVSRMGAGWTHLPRRRGARWVVPRGPRSAAAAALRIYQPVTIRGLVGWSLGRLLARIGLFRLLPRGEAPPAEVRAALAPDTSPDDTIAVARTRLPGRLVAMVVGPAGRSRVWAKVTSGDDVGALAREAECIRSIGSLLPPPVSAPLIRGTRPGVLLLEPVQWRLRLRPWRIPEDVARALGCMFLAGRVPGSSPLGPAHGDVAPWNLMRTKRSWVLVDWEHARTEAYPFHDLFHWLFRSHDLLGRPSRSALLTGFRGRGWVGRAIRAYAEGAELPVSAAPAFFRAYLEDSISRLDPGTAQGLTDIRTQSALLDSVKRLKVPDA